MMTAALIVAAGRGTRARASDERISVALPKQYARLGSRSVLWHTVGHFAQHFRIDAVQVVIHADDIALYNNALDGLHDRLRPVVLGGASRQESVAAGLEALACLAPDVVLIHDAARPFVDAEIIGRVIDGARAGAIAAEPLADTLKRAGDNGLIVDTLDRRGLWRAQTPQGFAFAEIVAAHRRAATAGLVDFTDDAALAEWAGLEVGLVRGSSRNIKLTTLEDMTMAQALLGGEALEPRSGLGFDVHRFCAGDHVWLCGVRVAHDMGLDGHSDADAPLHALTDALLGALGDGDIGQHFPPSDPQWKGARSRLFVEDAVRRVRERKGRIINADITVLCEAPRIGPHRESMRAELADMLGIEIGRVAVKATTTETLGFTGRREGLAAMAAVSVLLPA